MAFARTSRGFGTGTVEFSPPLAKHSVGAHAPVRAYGYTPAHGHTPEYGRCFCTLKVLYACACSRFLRTGEGPGVRSAYPPSTILISSSDSPLSSYTSPAICHNGTTW